MSDALLREVEQFLYRQAAHLDAGRWREYIELFDAEGVYWMPAEPSQDTWKGVPSVFAEDRDLMCIRMKRLQHPKAWSMDAPWATSHVVSNVVLAEGAPPDRIVADSRFHATEVRRDDVRHFAGSYRHELRRVGGALRIVLQRVDLLSVRLPFEYVLQAWL